MDLIDIVEPRCKKSKTDKAEPKRDRPNTENDEPILATLRNDKVDPI